MPFAKTVLRLAQQTPFRRVEWCIIQHLVSGGRDCCLHIRTGRPDKRPEQPLGNGPLTPSAFSSYRHGPMLEQPCRRIGTGEPAPPGAGCCWSPQAVLAYRAGPYMQCMHCVCKLACAAPLRLAVDSPPPRPPPLVVQQWQVGGLAPFDVGARQYGGLEQPKPAGGYTTTVGPAAWQLHKGFRCRMPSQ